MSLLLAGPRWYRVLAALLSLLLVPSPRVTAALPAPAPVGTPTPAAAPASPWPTAFEPNVGQAPAAVRYVTHTPAGVLLFMPTAVVLHLREPQRLVAAAGAPIGEAAGPPPPGRTLTLQWAGANPAPVVEGTARLPGRVNYLHGSDPAHWRTDIPTDSTLIYRDLYPGIDLIYTGTGQSLKGTYQVAPGADPRRIQWRYAGAAPPYLDAAGNVQITAAPTPGPAAPGDRSPLLTEQAPSAWQDFSTGRRPVATHFSVAADGTIGFVVGSYDPTQPLILDPYLLYATTFGGGLAVAEGVAVDSTGAMYVTGHTESQTYPLVDPFQGTFGGNIDVVVSKVNAAGTALDYSTYLGGSTDDYGLAIALDGQGRIYLTGKTNSWNFPVQHAYQTYPNGIDNVFVTALTSTGNALVYSTYLGAGHDSGRGIAVLPDGTTVVTGQAYNSGFPTYHALYSTGSQQAFIASFTPAGDLRYSTLMPGTTIGYAVALDSAGRSYVAGSSSGPGLPVAASFQPGYAGGASDGWVVALAADGQALRYTTYLGGSGQDELRGIAVDNLGQATLAGSTTSPDLLPPVGPRLQTPPYQPALRGGADMILLRLSADDSRLIYGTYYGGNGGEQAFGVALDPAGGAAVVGTTGSTDFPLVHPVQWQAGGDLDACSVKFNATGTGVLWSTYLGGMFDDVGHAVAMAANGNTVLAGGTLSHDFPVVRPLVPGAETSASLFLAIIGDACPLQFQDVPATSTFAAYISCLACRGIVGGYSDGTYRPAAGLTRGQFAKIIAGAVPLTATIAAGQQTFADMPPSSPFWLYVERAAGAGILGGYPCGTLPTEPCDAAQRPYYRPGVAITRGQVAKLVSNAAGWLDPVPATQQTFADVPPTQTFWEVVERTAAHGSISGYPCGPGGPGPCDGASRPYYLPAVGVTRGQAAKIVTGSFFPDCETRPPTPTPSATAFPTASSTPLSTSSPTATVTASATSSPTATSTASATVTATPTVGLAGSVRTGSP